MNLKLAFGALAVAASLAFIQTSEDTNMKKLTPIITVDEIEPCMAFWIDRLGYEKTMEVPEGDHLGFAAVASGGVEIMYQTRTSVAADAPALAEAMAGAAGMLFIEVADLDPVLASLEGADIVVPERTTFYGMREVFVRAPCGTVVGFAQPVAPEN